MSVSAAGFNPQRALAAFRENLSRALIVTRRELRDQLRDWRIIIPIIVLTLFFPLLMNFTAEQVIDFTNQFDADIVGERMIPFLLLVVGFFPISISLVIALESFVGEKERKSIEPLLVSPMTDLQLYLGKVIASTLPPLLASFLGITVYLAGLHFSIGWHAPLPLLALVVLLTAAQALVMVAGAVVISTQATSARAANLLASFIIIPMALLIQAEAIVMFWANYDVLWLFVLGLFAILAVLVRMGVKLFNREELLGREMDELKPGALLRHLWREFRGSATSPVQWWRVEVWAAVGRLRLSLAAILVLLIAGLIIGWQISPELTLPAEIFDFTRRDFAEMQAGLDLLGLSGVPGVFNILVRNAQVLGLATLLSIFSVGVLGMLMLMINFALWGLLAAQAAAAGVSPMLFFAALIVPHGVIEIPAILLLGAAILRLGASFISPPGGRTLGDGFIVALADWAKVALGLVLPMLILASVIEVFVTPRVAMALLF